MHSKTRAIFIVKTMAITENIFIYTQGPSPAFSSLLRPSPAFSSLLRPSPAFSSPLQLWRRTGFSPRALPITSYNNIVRIADTFVKNPSRQTKSLIHSWKSKQANKHSWKIQAGKQHRWYIRKKSKQASKIADAFVNNISRQSKSLISRQSKSLIHS